MGPMDNVNIGKGQAFRGLDAQWADLTLADCQTLLAELEDPNYSYVDTREQSGMISAAMANHIRTHWYGSTSEGFWPNRPNKEEIVRAGYAQAVRLVEAELVKGGPSIPIVVYWICAGHHFEVITCKSSAQVTVLILTPSVSPHASRDFPANRIPEDMWMVGNESDIDKARLPAIENWFEREDVCGPKHPTAFDGVFMTEIFGN